MRIIINEEEKNQISSQHEEIDSRLFNFLIRRLKKETIVMGGSDYGFDSEPISINRYTFEGVPSYGFSSYHSKKKWKG